MKIDRFIEKVNRVEKIFLAVIFMVLTLLIVANVICRKMGVQGFTFLDELSRFILVCTTFLAASTAVSEGMHPNVTLIQSLLPSKATGIITRVVSILCAALCGYIAYYGYQYMLTMYKVGRVSSQMRIVVWPIFLFIVITLCGACLRWLWLAVRPNRTRTTEGEEE